MLGRDILPEEVRPDRAREIILSYGLHGFVNNRECLIRGVTPGLRLPLVCR
jgi:hypothetical protein